jgi:hypothetical protein
MMEKEMKECSRRTGSRTNDGNGRKRDLIWSEDGDMEIGNDRRRKRVQPKETKNAHGAAGGKPPGSYKEQDKNDVVNKGGNGCTHKNLLVDVLYICVYKVATIYSNGIRSEPRHDMLAGFLHKQDINISLL